jgi:hypothetical protein
MLQANAFLLQRMASTAACAFRQMKQMFPLQATLTCCEATFPSSLTSTWVSEPTWLHGVAVQSGALGKTLVEDLITQDGNG